MMKINEERAEKKNERDDADVLAHIKRIGCGYRPDGKEEGRNNAGRERQSISAKACKGDGIAQRNGDEAGQTVQKLADRSIAGGNSQLDKKTINDSQENGMMIGQYGSVSNIRWIAKELQKLIMCIVNVESGAIED